MPHLSKSAGELGLVNFEVWVRAGREDASSSIPKSAGRLGLVSFEVRVGVRLWADGIADALILNVCKSGMRELMSG